MAAASLNEAAEGHFSQKHFFIDPHQAARLVGFALILYAVEAVSPLAVVSLVVVVEFHLPHSLKEASLVKLQRATKRSNEFLGLVTLHTVPLEL